MTTVAQMIELFKTMPQDAKVVCTVKKRGVTKVQVTFSISDCSVLDYTSEEDRAKYPHTSGKTIIMIQGE